MLLDPEARLDPETGVYTSKRGGAS